MVPSTAPIATLTPSAASTSPSRPACGAGTSSVTLSVSSSTTGSSRSTLSPGCFSQRATVASVTDSPRAGTLISTVIAPSTVDSQPSSSRGQRFRDKLRLFLHMALEQPRCRRCRLGAADKARSSRGNVDTGEYLLDAAIDKPPGAHVFRLLLAPHQFGIAVAPE